MPLTADKIAALDAHFGGQDFLTQLSPDQPPQSGLTPEKIAALDAHFGAQTQPQQAAPPTPSFFGSNRGVAPPNSDSPKDFSNSVMTGVKQAPFWLGDTIQGAEQGITRLAGVAYQGMGGNLSPEQARGLTNPPTPVYTSNEMYKSAGMPLYEPKTTLGMAGNMLGNAAGMGLMGEAAPLLDTQAANTNGFLASNTSLRKPPTPLPDELQNLDMLPDAAKGTMFAKKPNPIESGLKANQAISAQYGKDIESQASLYKDLNAKGSTLGIKTPKLYSGLDDLIGYLDNKVAVDTPEYKTLTELKEIRDNLSGKYGVEQQGAKPTVDASGELPTQGDYTAGAKASGIEPSDLVEIKTALNSGLKPNKFTNAGSGKILAFKKYVQEALDTASSVSPEFGKALKDAETQAARVGAYKSPELRTLWQPEDYVAWKAKQNNPDASGASDGTISRASTFLQNLNTTKAGRASAVARVLPPDQAQAIMRDAILHGKSMQPSIVKGIAQLPLHPFHGVKTIGATFIAPQKSNLSDLASQIKRMKK